MKITIIGTGYVGLVTGACLAEVGHFVKCLDVSKEKIDFLKEGKVPFYEPGLKNKITNGLNNGTLEFTSSYDSATKDTNIYFICVGSPPKKDGSTNLSYVSNSLKKISSLKKKDFTVFIKSTVPVGTNKLMNDLLNKGKKSRNKAIIVSNPEFLKEGDAIRDFMRPDRIIIGTHDEKIKKLCREIYKPLNKQKDKIIFMSPEAAELTKYAANSFLATKISFMNELSRICDSLNINIEDIRNGIGSDPRIGSSFLYSGLGYGGSCFPKDIDSLLNTFKKNNIKNEILSSVKKINETQIDYFLSKILSHYSNKELKEKSFTIWGLSFKPDTDDIRNSASINLVKNLSKQCKNLYLYDPKASDSAAKELKNINNIFFMDDPYSHIKESDSLIICTEWKIFWNPNYKKLRKLKDKSVFDGRNILEKHKMTENGLEYIGVGS